MQATQDDLSSLSSISAFMVHNEIRKQISLFGEIDAELDFTEYLIRSEIYKADEARFRSKKRTKELSADLVRALRTLSIEQLIRHYNVMVEQVSQLRRDVVSAPSLPSSSFLIVQAFAKSYTLKIWKRKKLRFDRENHIIYAEKDKKIKIYDLGNYLVRKSTTSDYVCLVLEATNDLPLPKNKTVHFGFEFKNAYNLWIHSIEASVIYKQWQRIATLLHKDSQLLQPTIKLPQESQTLKKIQKQLSIEPSHSQTQVVFSSNTQVGDAISSRKASERSSAHSLGSQDQSANSQFEILISEGRQFPEEKTELIEIAQKSYATRLITDTLNLTLQELQYDLQREPEALRKVKKRAPIYATLLQEYSLEQALSLQGFREIDFVSQASGLGFLYQSEGESTHMKFRYLSPLGAVGCGHAAEKLLKRLLDPNLVGSLNSRIRNFEIKSLIYSQNCSINYEEHSPYNRLFRARQFLYLRHLFVAQPRHYFVIDRSIEHPDLPRKEHLVRGTLFNITEISEEKGQIVVSMDVRLSYGSQLLPEQQINNSKQYLRLFAEGLSAYFSQPPPEPTKSSDFYDYQPAPHAKFARKVEHSTQQLRKLEGRLNSSGETCLRNTHESSGNQLLRIPRTQVLLQRNRYTESMWLGSEEITPCGSEEVHRKYEPPRRVNKNYLSAKFSFLEREQEHFDWKTKIVPEWTKEWVVNEHAEGLTYKGTELKQKELKQILEFTLRNAINKDQKSKLSFPVDILAPQSHLQRLLKSFGYAPSLFSLTASLSTMQKLKKVVTFGVLTSLLSLRVLKDFDPILGQTYQCEIPSSCRGYAEQMTPTKAGVLLMGKEFLINGIIQTQLKVLMNSATGEYSGVITTKFSDETQICFTLPSGELTGLAYGTPTFRLRGKSYYWIRKECLLLELNFQVNHAFSKTPDVKPDFFQGKICRVTPEFIANFAVNRRTPEEECIVEVLDVAKGYWTKCIQFGSERVLFEKVDLFEMISQHNSLPSDSSFREDINLLKQGRLQAAQAKKEALQDQERYDLGLRERSVQY